MRILIAPTIREPYPKQIEYSVDIKLIDFLKATFNKPFISIFNSKNKIKNPNLVVFSGGNDLFKKNKKEKLRSEIDNLLFKYCIKKKVSMIGICHGAQFISSKLKSKFSKSKIHVGIHSINLHQNLINKKRVKVNSFHKNIINFINNNETDILARADDNSIEMFIAKKIRALGIMWHPERYAKFKKIDKDIIRKFYDTYRSSSRKRK